MKGLLNKENFAIFVLCKCYNKCNDVSILFLVIEYISYASTNENSKYIVVSPKQPERSPRSNETSKRSEMEQLGSGSKKRGPRGRVFLARGAGRQFAARIFPNGQVRGFVIITQLHPRNKRAYAREYSAVGARPIRRTRASSNRLCDGHFRGVVRVLRL